MIVRKATLEDFPHYLALAREFHAASPMHNVIDLDAVGYEQFYTKAIHDDNIGIWIAEVGDDFVGITGALLYPIYFSPSNLVAQELWWWMTPKARGHGVGKAMFNAITEWAKAKNAKAVFMIALEDENVDKMTNLYAREGFKPMERTYIKEVA